MEVKMIILSSEQEFRNYVILHAIDITRIFVFEDELDEMIFCYCFMQNNSIIVSSEMITDSFTTLRQVYIDLANLLNLQICTRFPNSSAIELEQKNRE